MPRCRSSREKGTLAVVLHFFSQHVKQINGIITAARLDFPINDVLLRLFSVTKINAAINNVFFLKGG